ncbi:hypothetical protein LPMP_344970 [Leishmania panamensis]|uniref:SAM-dependent methyltransferase, putative n=1 Tax=Leishmania panamensis TaxID=5679 RepID=A0A088SJY6_LEIPA|nr:hypothetical protein LPMP_344970 [Leishmania panamensis]AIO02117.1 hypothetical protein LPMP_344970 [Leishmania panamensis]
MQRDTRELNPGRADFWEHFYDPEAGRLQEKELHHRKAHEIARRGSLMYHYEWFMEYPLYEDALKACIQTVPTVLPTHGPTRILHAGCGNSSFCDHAEQLLSDLDPALSSSSTRAPEVLNVDICQNLITLLARHFPSRLYAVGNCCDLHVSSSPSVPFSSDTIWYSRDTALQLHTVLQSSVDIVFDKGTADALLSAFAGEFNPNMESYMGEMLKILRPGGLFFLISINSEDVVNPYVLSAEDGVKSFQLAYMDVIELASQDLRHVRVETLGSRYNCYGYTVVASASIE